MTTNEVKEMRVVRVEYIAEDGEIFHTAEDCMNYEKSVLFVARKNLVKLNTKYMSVYNLLEEGCDDTEIEVFDIQTEKDLDNLKKYLYLKARQNGAKEDDIEKSNINNITSGHEVLIWWSYDNDFFYIYGNGSFEAYLNVIRKNFNRCIGKEENNAEKIA